MQRKRQRPVQNSDSKIERLWRHSLSWCLLPNSPVSLKIVKRVLFLEEITAVFWLTADTNTLYLRKRPTHEWKRQFLGARKRCTTGRVFVYKLSTFVISFVWIKISLITVTQVHKHAVCDYAIILPYTCVKIFTNLILRLPHIQHKRTEYFPLLNIQGGNISEIGGQKKRTYKYSQFYKSVSNFLC